VTQAPVIGIFPKRYLLPSLFSGPRFPVDTERLLKEI